MPLNVIGISAFYHDAACCLLQDGELVAAAEEERFSRLKHDAGLPWRAFKFCLEQGGIAIDQVDCVAFYEDPAKKRARQEWMGQKARATHGRPPAGLTVTPRDVLREIREGLGYDGPLRTVEHHQAHAASSFFFSGFEEAALLTVDGVGEWTTTAYGRGHAGGLELFEEVAFPHSLGLLYGALTAYLGFEVNDGEYKVMGLAPYGQPRYLDQVHRLIRRVEPGRFALEMEYFDFIAGERMYSDRLVELFGQPPRPPGADFEPFHEDLAATMQVVLEELLLEEVRYLHGRVPSENLCMAGGVALNCVANSRVLRDGPFRRLFVQPAASDAGGAVGAAALAHLQLAGSPPPRRRMTHALLGPAFAPADIHDLLRATGVKAHEFGDDGALLEAVVDRLADGQVVGWFTGRMEFGPRALGARSILADPRDPGMRDRINALVKQREAFRPFAPAVLMSRAAEHFDLDHDSPFMLETCQVRSPLQLPAITHVDGSARVQTVAAIPETARYAALIERFAARTGCPILLNTSFNMRGEPIVCTPLDAIICFVRSGIDALVLEDLLIDRDGIPALWGYMTRATEDGTPRGGISRDVYTFF